MIYKHKKEEILECSLMCWMAMGNCPSILLLYDKSCQYLVAHVLYIIDRGEHSRHRLSLLDDVSASAKKTEWTGMRYYNMLELSTVFREVDLPYHCPRTPVIPSEQDGSCLVYFSMDSMIMCPIIATHFIDCMWVTGLIRFKRMWLS